MDKFFNTAGPCQPDIHYVLPPLARSNLPELEARIAAQQGSHHPVLAADATRTRRDSPRARSTGPFNLQPDWLAFVLLALVLTLTPACSIKRFAVNKVGDALASGGTTFASDDDPELVRAAVPFSLKLMESLLAESPRHRGLLFATASGFTQYAYAFVQQDADELEEKDLAAATALKARATRLYLRARDYGLRGLDAAHRGFSTNLLAQPTLAVRLATQRDVPLLYWTAVSWGAAISLAKDDPDLIAQIPQMEALIDRALALDESFDHGAIHAFLITYEMARSGQPGNPAERSRRHLDRAMALAGGTRAGPLVAFAEAVSVAKQNLKEFETLLGQALAVNPDAQPETRLVNLVMQRRARWLLARKDELFLIPDSSPAK
jgi:predicted anti-sigma-YlaC factor YlaD